jgi:hypothetical protein
MLRVDALMELMLKDGVAAADAMRAYGCVMSFAVGSAQFERVMMGGGDVAARRFALVRELAARAPGRYASLTAVAAKVDRWCCDDLFDLGIRSLLSGIDPKCPPEGHAPRTPRARRVRA